MKIRTLFILCILMSAPSLQAATYYVANNGSSGNSGSQVSPWSVSKANSTALAGDTIILLDGNYTNNTMISPANSGTSGNPIIFQAENKHGVLLTSSNNNTPPIKMNGKDYISFDGIKVRDSSRWFQIENCEHITMKNCDMENDTGIAQSYTIGRFYYCESVHISDCSFSGGYDLVKLNTGDNHLIENNFFGDALHTALILLGVKYSRVRDNTFNNRLWRAMEVETQRESPFRWSEYNVIEGNEFQFSFNGIQYAGNKSIIRKNTFRHVLEAFDFANYLGGAGAVPEAWYDANNRFYNNVIAECGYNSIVQSIIASNAGDGYDVAESVNTSAVALSLKTNLFNPTVTTGINPQPIFEDNILLNNIFYKNSNSNDSSKTNVSVHLGWNTDPSQVEAHHNTIYTGIANAKVILRDDEPGPNDNTLSYFETNYSSQFYSNNEDEPGFTNGPSGDFNLSSSSDCIDAGSFLTTTASSGSGTSITVTDALYFSDGEGLTTGDYIRIGNATCTITSINYGSNTLTVSPSISWVSGVGVALNYSGNAPDIGAFEYTATPSNTAPVVNAGSNHNTTLPSNTVALNATVSDDGLPSASLTYAWTKHSGPASVSFANASAVDTNATFTVAGTYVLKLSVSDGALSSNDTLTVTVNPENNVRKITITLPNDQYSADITPTGSASSSSNTYYFSDLNISHNHTLDIVQVVNN